MNSWQCDILDSIMFQYYPFFWCLLVQFYGLEGVSTKSQAANLYFRSIPVLTSTDFSQPISNSYPITITVNNWAYQQGCLLSLKIEKGSISLGQINICINSALMQGIGDPDLFELSEVVEKSSKSGIFSNRRLLMVKDGFLYYFSQVPADYKGHEPGVMSTLKQYPKSSIEIRTIKEVRLESPKSCSLIICFNSKDMIERQDIRKSVQSKNFQHPKKANTDEEEWKFTFTSYMKCRVWYTSLLKLKAHFQKNHEGFDRFTEYMANFDNELRQSLPRQSPSSKSGRISAPANRTDKQHLSPQRHSAMNNGDKFNLGKQAGIYAIPEAAEQYDDDTSHQSYNPNAQPSAITKKESVNLQKKEEIPQKEALAPIKQEQKANKRNTVQKKVQKSDKKIEQIIPETNIVLQKDSSVPSKKAVELVLIADKTIKKPEQPQTKIISPIQNEKPKLVEAKDEIQDIIQKQQQRLNQQRENVRKQQQIAESIRREQRMRAQEQARVLQQQLVAKQAIIKQMQREIEANRSAQLRLQEQVQEEKLRREEEQRMRLILEREKKEEEEYRRLHEFVPNEHSFLQQPSKEILLIEQSIQTEFGKDLIEVLQGEGHSNGKGVNIFSYRSEFSLNQGQFQNTHRHTNSSISAGKSEPRQPLELQSYDYFWQMSQLYKESDSGKRVGRELALAEFVRRASRQAAAIISAYIDENRPKQSLKLERHIFEIEIVCERGRTLQTEGTHRLLYGNEQHQRLKRTFKVYNQLTEVVLHALKRKPGYGLRVPLCCLVEYKGYTALAQIVPARLTPASNPQLLRTLGPDLPTYNLKLHEFSSHREKFYLATVDLPYKCSKEDQICLLRAPGKTIDFLDANRRQGISIESRKLYEEAELMDSSERTAIADILTFCRQLKRVMKHETPFLETHKQFQFFEQLLRAPAKFIRANSLSECPLSGILVYYIQRLLGLRLSSKIGEQVNYSVQAVVRQLSLCALDASLFASKFQRFCTQGKFQLAQQALLYAKQLQQDYAQVLLRQVSLQIFKQNYSQALVRMELAEQMLSLHDPRRLKLLEGRSQCCEALGQGEEALGYLKRLLEETEYMYRERARLVDIYFLVADTFARQGLTRELVEVYRRILRDSPEQRPRVIVDFSQMLLAQQTDPHLLLDFLQQETPEQQRDTPDTQVLLGDLYMRCRNAGKARGCYQSAFESLLLQPERKDVAKVFGRLMESSASAAQCKHLHRQLVLKCPSGVLAAEQCRAINTLAAEMICQGMSEAERERVIASVQESRCVLQPRRQVRLAQWGQLQELLGEGRRVQELLRLVEGGRLVEACVLLNSQQLI